MEPTPDYKGFVKHYNEWKCIGAPVSLGDMISLAEKYHTPIPDDVKDFLNDKKI